VWQSSVTDQEDSPCLFSLPNLARCQVLASLQDLKQNFIHVPLNDAKVVRWSADKPFDIITDDQLILRRVCEDMYTDLVRQPLLARKFARRFVL
jgi:hypothetical protein